MKSGLRLPRLLAWSPLAAASLVLAADLSIGSAQPMSFGKFAAGSGGSVLIAPNGARSAAGGVALLSSDPGAPARFELMGDPNTTYALTLPANGTVSLTSGSGHSMPLTDFSVSPAASGQLNALGRQSLSVGARLNVSPQQPSGSYGGDFVVYVDYN